MDEQTEYPITVVPHADTGLEPMGFDCYYESYPNAIVAFRGSMPYKFRYEDISLIIGPEMNDDIMGSVKRTVEIQKYEYLLTMDRRAMDFASFIEKKDSPSEPEKHDHTNYGWYYERIRHRPTGQDAPRYQARSFYCYALYGKRRPSTRFSTVYLWRFIVCDISYRTEPMKARDPWHPCHLT